MVGIDVLSDHGKTPRTEPTFLPYELGRQVT
jgi:hypothetical protein